MLTCYLSVGSNLGTKSKNIEFAIDQLRRIKGIRVLKVSPLIRTKAQGGPKGQPDFLNGALKIKTSIPAESLLKVIKKIESKIGRIKAPRNFPRVIDIDILLYGDRIVKSRDLVIPHPAMFKRDFVIKPLLSVLC